MPFLRLHAIWWFEHDLESLIQIKIGIAKCCVYVTPNQCIVELMKWFCSKYGALYNEIALQQSASSSWREPTAFVSWSTCVEHIANLYKLWLFIETSRTDDLSKPEARCLSSRSLFFLFHSSFNVHVRFGNILNERGTRNIFDGCSKNRYGQSMPINANRIYKTFTPNCTECWKFALY